MSGALLCLDLRQEHVGRVRDGVTMQALRNCIALLDRARAEKQRIVHAHTRTAHEGAEHGAYAGLEPWADEPVFALNGVSALDQPRILELARAQGAAGLTIIGAAYSRAGLATALSAQELGVQLKLASEACFSSAAHPAPAQRVLALIRGASAPEGRSNWAGENVVCLETWRT